MYFLNDLDDYKLYRNRKLLGINKNNKEYKKNNLLLFIGDNPDFNSLTNGNILYNAYFKSYFVPFKFTTTKLNKVIKLNQEEIYNKVLAQNCNLNTFRKSISLYKNFNLIYDFTYELKANMNEVNYKGQKYISKFISEIANKYKTVSYKEKVIVMEVKPGDLTSGVSLNNANSYFQMLYIAMKKKLADPLNGAIILLYTSNGCYVKFKYDKNIKLPLLTKVFTKISNAAKASGAEVVMEDEPPKKDIYVSDNILTKDIKLSNIKQLIAKSLGISDTKPAGKIVTNQLDKLEELITKKLNDMNVSYEKLDDEAILDLISTEPEIIKEVEITKDIAMKGIHDDAEIRRLRKKQDEVEYNGKKLKDILEEAEDLKIEETKIDNAEIINEEVKHNTVSDFDKSYYNKQMKKDIMKTFAAFNDDEDIPLFVKSIKSENTSDNFTKKITYHITFQDTNGLTHTVNINYPVLKDGKFMIINGGKKLLLKQLMLLPIVKTKPDTVQISTNYNKLFVTRFGDKLNDGTINIKKLLFSGDIKEHINKDSGFMFKLGNVIKENKGFAASLEYGELAKNLMFIEDNIYEINFNLKEINKALNDPSSLFYKKSLGELNNYDSKDYFCIGWLKGYKTLLLSNLNNSNILLWDGKNYTKVSENLIMFLLDEIFKKGLSEDKIKEFYSYSHAKTLTYNRVRITGKAIPLIIVLAYERGLSDIMNRYGIKYQFVSSERVNKKFGQKRIKFADGFLLYDSLDLKSTLLLDGITSIDTSEYTFADMDTKTPYIEWFYDNCGSRNTGKGVHNMLSLMIDPITKEILESLKLPTNIIDVMLYANTLLANSSYKTANDMSCYRVRGAEQVNAVLYKVLADAFKTYKDTSNNGNPIKISVEPDILIKTLVGHKTVDEYSILNPSLEIDKISAATFKGPSGINLDDAYTTDIRSYDLSMQGILGASSPYSDKIGVVRQLTYDAKILNTRGMLDTDPTNRNANTNIYCPSEILNSFTQSHSDPVRIAMQTTQQKHTIPVNDQSAPLFGSGVDKTLPYLLGDDFVFVAEESGIIEKIDTKKEIAIVKYDSGKSDIIDLSEIISKNSNGGFFLANKKELLFKQGQRFNKDDVLAKNPNYFKGNTGKNVTYSTGRLCNIAVANLDATMEDSSMISSGMSKAMTAKITMKKDVVLGPNANIEYLVKPGAKVKTGDDLVIFDTSFEDDSINTLLGGLDEVVGELTKNTLHSKYTGRIVDVNLYWNHDIEEYSPSVRKIIEEYIANNKAKNDMTNKVLGPNTLRLINTKSIEKINDTKIKGKDVDGLMIEIYIEYETPLGIGKLYCRA